MPHFPNESWKSTDLAPPESYYSLLSFMLWYWSSFILHKSSLWGSHHCSQGLLPSERALLYGSQSLLKFSMRLNSMNLTSHIVTAKWYSKKLLLAWLLPSVWVIPCFSRRASLDHSGWFLTLHNVKRKEALGTSLCTQNK